MAAWWWLPIGAVLSAAAVGAGRAATRWFIDALRRSLVIGVTEIVTPLIEALRAWAETAIVQRLDDHEQRLSRLETDRSDT